MDHIQAAFGEDADLYTVLGLKDRDEAENPAKLRKAYFRKALVYHPDKTKEKDAEVAKEKFQAISFAYQVLKNPEKRAEYNESGHVDEEGDSDDEDNDKGGKKNWKDYFDLIFGKVSTSQIDAFALKYKCSEEEQRDVLNEYRKRKGDLVKMLEYVMLSEPLDCRRWLEDYINPACEAGTVPDYDDMLKKSMKKIETKIEKEQKKSKKSKGKSKKENKKPDSDEDSDDIVAEADSDATETEESDDEEVVASPVAQKKKKGQPTKKASAQKAKPTKAKAPKKKSKGGGKEEDLFAMIAANQAKRSGGVMRSLGARYGVAMDEDDPLGDDEFEKIQARLNKKKRSR